MATYLQGVTDYIPQVQPFSPDYNFYSGALDLKQSKYDAARTQLSNLYGSLLNAPLTRQDNAEARDKFFKTIEQDIQKMATVDLSLKQNQVAAQGVFNQLLDNKSIRKDMVWTRNFESQVRRSQGFKNCIDGEKCGGQWWKGGDRLLEYSRKEFQMMDADKALYAADAEYIPQQDITKMAMKLAKEADLNVTQDQLTGQWITTTKNGPLIMKPLSDLFKGVIGNDSKVQEYYNAKAKLNRKDWTYSNEQQYGSIEAAEQAYIQQMTPIANQLLGKTEELESEVASNESKKKKVEEKIQNATPEDQESLADVYDDLEKRGDAYNQSLDSAKKDEEIIRVAGNNQAYSAEQIDALMSSYSLGEDINNAATTLAYKDYEQTIKENPYAMEAVKHANRVALENLKQVHALEKIDYEAAVKVDLFNQGIGTGSGSGSGAPGVAPSGGAEHNSGEVVTDIKGATDVGSGDELSMANAARGFRQTEGMRNEMRADISNAEKQMLDQIVMRTKTAATNGDAQAQEDLVAIVENYVAAANVESEDVSRTSGKYKENANLSLIKFNGGRTLQRLQKANTLAEKYAIANKFVSQTYKDGTNVFDVGALKGAHLDAMYKSTLKPMIDQGDKANVALRDYLTPVWEGSHALRNEIAAKDIALEQFDQHYAEAAHQVAAAVKSQESKQWGDAIEAYVDENGHINDQETFVKNMVDKGYSATEAATLYNFDREKTSDEATVWENIQASAEAAGSWIWNLGGIAGEYEDWQYNLNEDAVGGKAVAGIHDYYKRAYSKYAKPDSDSAFLQLKGLGGDTAMAKKFKLDSAAYKSIAATGTRQILEDALNTENSSIYFGDPKSKSGLGIAPLPREVAEQILYDLQNEHKGKKRIIGDVTYQNIAEGDKNKVAVHIEVPRAYYDNYKGSKEDPGIMSVDKFKNQGITIVIPKSETTNLFTEGSKKSHWEYVMGVQGKIDFDQAPKYAKNMTLATDPNTGAYTLTGQLFNGLDENGKPTYRTMLPQSAFGTADLNQIIQGIDQQIYTVMQLGKQAEADWVANNK